MAAPATSATDLSQYGNVTSAPPDLSQYGTVSDKLKLTLKGPGVGGMKPLKLDEVVPEREAEKKAANRAGYEGMAETALSAAAAYGTVGAIAKAPSVIAGLRAGGMPAIKKYAANALLEAGAAFGTYEGVSRGLESVGVNSTLANIAGALAGLGMGGKIEEYLGKDTFEKLAAKEWEAKFGAPPKTPGEKLRARGMAQAEVAKGRNAGKPAKPLSAKAQAEATEAQKAAKIKESADQYRVERGPLPERKPLKAKPADIPEGPDVKHTAPEPGRRPAPPSRKPTPKEKLAGRVLFYAREGAPKADIPELTREPGPAPDTRTTKEKIEAGKRKRTEAGPAGPTGTTPASSSPPAGTATEGSSYSFTHPKDSITDLQKQVFSRISQIAKKKGISERAYNLQGRERFEKLYGHGISTANNKELQEFNEYIANNGKLPPVKGEGQ